MTTSLATLPAAADGLTVGPSITIRADFVPGEIVMESERTVQNTATASRVPDFGRQHEVVDIFDSYDELEVAIDALLTSGFARCELSLAAEQSGGRPHHVHSHDLASAWPALSPEDQDL